MIINPILEHAELMIVSSRSQRLNYYDPIPVPSNHNPCSPDLAAAALTYPAKASVATLKMYPT